MRVAILALVGVLSSCAVCRRPVTGLGLPRVEDKARGVPKTIWETSHGLLDLAQMRRCQVVLEPAFSNPHAVWFVQNGAWTEATVFVKVHTNDGVESYSAVLDGSTAGRLSQLCLTALTADFRSCEPLGRDGVWYHVAHPLPTHAYAMASFWTPRQGTVANAVVKVAEALRNYATLPESLRYQAWIRLQESENDLSKRLAQAGVKLE
jgi:hypothetical protein